MDGPLQLFDNEPAAQVMGLKTLDRGGVMSQGREGALAVWKEGQCVRSCSVASTGFCRFALSDDQRHCFLGLDEKSKVAHLRVTIEKHFSSVFSCRLR